MRKLRWGVVETVFPRSHHQKGSCDGLWQAEGWMGGLDGSIECSQFFQEALLFREEVRLWDLFERSY